MSSVDPLSSFHVLTLLDTYQARVENALRDMHDQQILTRLWNQDHTIWKREPTEIYNRLGWLQSVGRMSAPAGHGRLKPRASRVCSPL
jgi:hypothetical protein